MSSITERRQLAVLAADIAGYAAQMEADEAATHACAMHHLHDIIGPALASAGGRLVKHTGDGFLAVFPGCAAALAAALGLQTALAADAAAATPALAYRMALHWTDAILEPHDVFGEGVNLAARLQSVAEPGRVVLSEAVVRELNGARDIVLSDLGVLSLKHLRSPVRAYACGEQAAPPVLTPGDNRPSIAVMPFRLHPADPDGEWLANGIIEGVLHVLSGIENLLVIAHGTAVAHAGAAGAAARDPVAVGAALGVRYVLGGSIWRQGERLRVMTELCDAATGTRLRSERLDGEAADIFDMQERMARDVVAAIAPAVRAHELARAMREHPESLGGYHLLLRGLDVLYRLDRASYDDARGLLQRAMAEAPGFGSTYAHAATWHMFRVGQGWSPDIARDADEARRCAELALARDPHNSVALAMCGQMLSFTARDYAGALRMLDRAVQVGPNCHMAWTLRATTRGWMGDADGAIADCRMAMRISPLDPFAFFTKHMLSQASYFGGHWDEAVRWGREAAEHTPRLTSNLRTLAAALVARGDVEEGRRLARRILEIEPGFTLGRFAARTPIAEPGRQHYIARLRTAGLPD
jgi:adenylate cyclase